MASVPKGSRFREGAFFYDNTSDTQPQPAIDPGTVKFQYQTPALVTTTLVYGTDLAVIKLAIGQYYVDMDYDTSGDWTIHWITTGIGKTAEPDRVVNVLSSVF